jgi:signal peptidase I
MDEKNTNIPENECFDGAENENLNEPEKKPGLRFLKEIIDWLETFAFAFAFVIVVFTFMFKIVTVEGRSMHYTLDEGDKLIITDMFYTPKTGDIVVIQEPYRYDKPIIKRVIATEGQKVKIDYDKWAVYVDGVLLDEPYVNIDEKNEGYRMENFGCVEEFTVAQDNVFVMGDNRNNSSDSRTKEYTLQENGSYLYTGYTEEEILGRVIIRLTPFDKFGKISPATEDQIAEIKEKK